MLIVIHVSIVLATLAVVFYADEQGLSWILGKQEVLPARKIQILHTLVGVGLASIIATGGLLFLRSPGYYLGNATFLIKMCLVAALVINGFVITFLNKIATTRSWKSLTLLERVPL